MDNVFNLLSVYKEFFEEAPVALIRSNIETGRILMANKYCANLFGYDTTEELLERERTTNLYESLDERKRLIETIRKRGQVKNYELKLHLHNGKEIWVSAAMHFSRNLSCLEGCLVNITDQKAAKEAQASHLRAMLEMNRKLDQALTSA